jgi:hypothetical protein
MPGRSRRGSSFREPAADEGPFASFTDLFIGILFLFLILVAALMLMHQEAIQREKVETQLMSQRIRQMQAKLDAAPKRDDRPAFRLGIVFNIYQRPAVADAEWTFARTVRVFRSPNGFCINTVMLRSNLSTAWRPPVRDEDIPTPAQQEALRSIEPCGLSASGDHWNLSTETGNMKRVSANLYDGAAVLHKKEGDVKIEIQYRVLGIYDDYFR